MKRNPKFRGFVLKSKQVRKAEEMYLRAFEKFWDVDPSLTFDTVNNLGNLYQHQNKMKEAGEMYLRALSKYENSYGIDHPSTLITTNNLGILYSSQGKMEEAQKMFLQALTAYEKKFGVDHTSTLDAINNWEICIVQASRKTGKGRRDALTSIDRIRKTRGS